VCAEEGDKPESAGEMLEMISEEFEFEPTLDDLATRSPPFRFFVDVGTDVLCYYRDPTDEERKSLVHPGETLRFPVAWTLDGVEFETYTISKTKWKAGVRWTMERFLDLAQKVYSKNNKRNLKRMGDHIFFEGIDKDGTICVGS
jgi:hypothetical protein